VKGAHAPTNERQGERFGRLWLKNEEAK